jgi:hypothetical protein
MVDENDGGACSVSTTGGRVRRFCCAFLRLCTNIFLATLARMQKYLTIRASWLLFATSAGSLVPSIPYHLFSLEKDFL